MKQEAKIGDVVMVTFSSFKELIGSIWIVTRETSNQVRLEDGEPTSSYTTWKDWIKVLESAPYRHTTGV